MRATPLNREFGEAIERYGCRADRPSHHVGPKSAQFQTLRSRRRLILIVLANGLIGISDFFVSFRAHAIHRECIVR